MTRCANLGLAAVLCGTAALVALWSLAGSLNIVNQSSAVHLPEYSAAEVEALYAETVRLDRQARDSTRFHAVLEQEERRLEQEQCRLAEAVEAVYTAARDVYPQYLENIRTPNDGPDDRARIAANLVRGLEADLELGRLPAGEAAVVRRLRQQLKASPLTAPPRNNARQGADPFLPTS